MSNDRAGASGLDDVDPETRTRVRPAPNQPSAGEPGWATGQDTRTGSGQSGPGWGASSDRSADVGRGGEGAAGSASAATSWTPPPAPGTDPTPDRPSAAAPGGWGPQGWQGSHQSPAQPSGQPYPGQRTDRARIDAHTQPPHEPSPGQHPGAGQQPWGAPPPQHPGAHPTAGQQWPTADAAPATRQSGEILTLPPMDELEPEIPLSEATGQPRRDPVMLVGMTLLYAGAVAGAVTYGRFWWDAIHIKPWLRSARLIQWTQPDTWSLAAVLWTTLLTVLALVFVSAPAIAGFQAWNGHRFSRWLAVGAAASTFLAPILFTNIGWFAPPLAVAGAAVLWLPRVSTYFAHWAAFRTPAAKRPVWVENVPYGPERRCH